MPSSGSTTQRSPVEPGRSSPSSPRTASSGRRAASSSRIARSASRSASETRSVGRRLRRDLAHAALVVVEQHGGRRARRGHRHVEQVVGAHSAAGGRSAHGRACSICAASESSVASSPGRPTSWTASGRPSASKPGGHRGRGLAGGVEDPVVRHPRDDRVERPQRAAAVELADAERRPGGPGREHDVGVVEDRVHARGHGRLGGARPGEPARRGRARRAAPSRACAARGARGAPLRRRRRGSRAGSAPRGSARPPARSRSRARRRRGRASAAARPSPPARRAARLRAAPARPAAALGGDGDAQAAPARARRPRRSRRRRAAASRNSAASATRRAERPVDAPGRARSRAWGPARCGRAGA